MYIANIKHISNIKHRIMYILLEKDTNARKIYPLKKNSICSDYLFTKLFRYISMLV